MDEGKQQHKRAPDQNASKQMNKGIIKSWLYTLLEGLGAAQCQKQNQHHKKMKENGNTRDHGGKKIQS